MDMGDRMLKRKSGQYKRILFTVSIIVFAIPLLAMGHDTALDTGHDWYCPDPEAHAQYEKHRKLHVQHQAGAVAVMLEKIYSDATLTAEQKNAETVAILNKHLFVVQSKLGVGD